MSSKTNARRPVGSSYSTSLSFTMCGCGDRRRSAWISRRLFTVSRLSKWFFMHLIATYRPDLMLCALRTSEKVPSPFFEISRYLCIAPRDERRRLRTCPRRYWLCERIHRPTLEPLSQNG